MIVVANPLRGLAHDAAYLRCLLENPDLLVVENLAAGLGPAKRRRAARFAEVYRARCPGGTFVQFEA